MSQMEVDELKLNPNNINLDDLDLYLTLFLWPQVPNCEKIRDLKDLDAFNEDNYDQAIGTYIKWKNEALPAIKDADSAAEQHKHIRLQVIAILRKCDPEHPIFEMTSPDEWSPI